MIAYLRGTIKHVTPSGFVLDVGGVGYWVLASATLLSSMTGKIEESLEIWCVHQTREDSSTLYGFPTLDERSLFLLLTNVPGIGGRVALSLLGTLGINTLVGALLSDDKKTLSQAEGVGPKMAARLITEMSSKHDQLVACNALEPSLSSKSNQKTDLSESMNRHIQEAIGTLEHLGYARQHVHHLVQNLALQCQEKDKPWATADLIQKALKELSKDLPQAKVVT